MAKSATVSQILNGLHANSMSKVDESSTHATETLVRLPQEGCDRPVSQWGACWFSVDVWR